MRALFEVADILNNHWDAACSAMRLNSWQWRTLDAVRRCRTAALGGHVDLCDQCGHVRISYPARAGPQQALPQMPGAKPRAVDAGKTG